MPVDSTADLLFRISADSADAEGNIKRFRTIMSKDLGDMGAEFEGWAKKVFGDIGSLQGLVIGAGAGLAAAVVGIGGALIDAAQKSAKYTSEIERGSKVTGIAAEDMSRLRYSARMVGLDYDVLVGNLTRFEANVVKAAGGNEQLRAAFARMHITDKDLQEGQRNLAPLLMNVATAFNQTESAVLKAAAARDLFGRGGASAEMLVWLSRGAEGLRKLGEEADRLGFVFTNQDIQAAKGFNTEMKLLKAEIEGVTLSVGKEFVPALMQAAIALQTAMVMARQRPAKSDLEDWKSWGLGALGPVGMIAEIGRSFKAFGDEYDKQEILLRQRMKAAMARGDGEGIDLAKPSVKEASNSFRGLSDMLEGLRQKTAGVGSEQARLTAEVQHYIYEYIKAGEELDKTRKKGDLTGEALRRELIAMTAIPGQIAALAAAQAKEITEKRNQAILEAGEDLDSRLAGQRAQSFEAEYDAWDAEIAKLRTHLLKKEALIGENVEKLADLTKAGFARIRREQGEAYVAELVQLQEHLSRVISGQMTARERLTFQYEQDLTRYSEVEQEKHIRAAGGEAARAQVEEQFAINRRALTRAYQGDLNALLNSQGWRGVFGAPFAAMIRGDEALLREWATSANQSHMLVRVTMEGLRETGQHTFASMAQGMGQNIANAIAYSKSTGEAVRSAAASTVESLAAEALVYAIYSTGLGFLRLAQHDYVGAGQAFTSAAIWGTMGGVAAIAGRAIAPKQEGQGGAAEGGQAGKAGAVSETPLAGSGAQKQGGPRTTVIVQGNVFGISGVQELCEIINEAVEGRDVRLISTASKSKKNALQ